MAKIISALRNVPAHNQLASWPVIRDAMTKLHRAIFRPYRPERHYMRGPGPACRAKEQRLLAEQSLSIGRQSAP